MFLNQEDQVFWICFHLKLKYCNFIASQYVMGWDFHSLLGQLVFYMLFL